ncbi:uncharacterized protein LOC128497768 [Spea bombifrons]|uniref:uncharacterized protein LOC128497768 n=1 Tax=Spea bombifrons TaxID=233779 RepID=UPI00234A1157|nr:uncharacterized protein LOC128497768 [Spea bombifrons]
MKHLVLLLVCGAVGWAQFCGLQPGAVNVARSGTASQSSTYELDQLPTLPEAFLAIDGIKTTDHFVHPCTHTKADHGPWWRLDLKKSFKIDAVVIVNRMNCCPGRLHGAQIRVGNSDSNNNPICGTITDVSDPTIAVCCQGMEGRFITVVIPDRAEYLSLCEVEVYGRAAVNLARLGTASQSSTFNFKVPPGEASLAIDGNKETNYFIHACAHTNGDHGPWWRLDLQKSFKIDAVVIVNRMDCCPNRLLGAQIRIGNSDSNNNPICGTITDVSQATIAVCCKGMEGRFITVVIPDRAEYLTLCEMEVYGQAAMEEPQVCWTLARMYINQQVENLSLWKAERQHNLRMKCFLLLLVCGAVGWAQFCGLKPGAVNLARSGTASQSSTYNSNGTPGEASLAIDGNNETNYFIHACAHTKGDHGPWWRLDLQKSFKIDAVVIVNRMDCCPNRLLGAQIRIGNSDSNNNPICSTITDVSQATIAVCCNGMEGRFITMVIPDRTEYLSFCEVEVYGDAGWAQFSVNLARSGTASQSSTYNSNGTPGEASLAIDGNNETNYFIHACAHTKGDHGPWWRLDLQKSFKIDAVVIVNRMDCCPNRLLGAQIRIGNSDSNNNPICSTITDVSQATIAVCCNGMEGRYITVVIPDRTEYLSFCEVEVYGDVGWAQSCGLQPGAVNLARSGTASQSSTYNFNITPGEASLAIDGNKETNYFIHACAHTNGDHEPWWRLDLQKSFKIDAVVIVNRMDCCPNRLLGAQIRIGNSDSNNNPICSTITDVSKATIAVCCNGMEGRYITVMIPDCAEYLSFCEVEVYGDAGWARFCGLQPGGEASLAIDGNNETNYFIHACAHTKGDHGPWWRLDLQKSFKIDAVVIVNRMDCCPNRLLGAQIRIGNSDSNNNPICGTITDVSDPTIAVCCKGMEGRFITVVIPDRTEYLSLCEVEVYGQAAMEEPRVCW